MTKRFPTFKSHAAASCFNCGIAFQGACWRKSGHAPRNGQYAQDCRKCGMFTCYEVKERSK